jgi:hypothetical protein
MYVGIICSEPCKYYGRTVIRAPSKVVSGKVLAAIHSDPSLLRVMSWRICVYQTFFSSFSLLEVVTFPGRLEGRLAVR